jgi:hypothetical protein
VPAKLPVRVTGLITAEDVIGSLKAVGKWQPWRTVMIAVPMLLLVAFLQGINRPRRGGALPILLLIPLIMLLLIPLRARRRVLNSWKDRPEYHQPISWTFSEEGVLIETISSQTLRSWNGFLYAHITPDRIVLAQPGDAMFNFVPRRLFESDGQWLAVCQLLASKLPVRETGKR